MLTTLFILALVNGVYSTSGDCGVNCEWSYDTATTTLTVSPKDETLPADMGNYTQTGEDLPWYSYKMKAKTAVINEGFESIGVYAFVGFRRITSITIPKSVKVIHKSAFSGTAVTELPNIENVEELGYKCFGSFKITSAVIPKSVKKNGRSYFLL